MNHRNKSSEVPEKDPMGQFFVNMLSDAGFKAVLGDRANKRVLIQTLNHVLPDYARIKDIKHYRDREQNQTITEERRQSSTWLARDRTQNASSGSPAWAWASGLRL